MAAKKNAPQSGNKGRGKVEKVMHEFKEGQLKSGGRKKVENPKQAIAIALSEARASGANIPDRRSAAKRSAANKSAVKKTASKKTAVKKTAAKKTVTKKKAAAKKAARR